MEIRIVIPLEITVTVGQPYVAGGASSTIETVFDDRANRIIDNKFTPASYTEQVRFTAEGVIREN